MGTLIQSAVTDAIYTTDTPPRGAALLFLEEAPPDLRGQMWTIRVRVMVRARQPGAHAWG